MDFTQLNLKQFYKFCIVLGLLMLTAFGYHHLERINRIAEEFDSWREVNPSFKSIEHISIVNKISDFENEIDLTNYTKSQVPIGPKSGSNIVSTLEYYIPNRIKGHIQQRKPAVDSLNQMLENKARIEVEIEYYASLHKQLKMRLLVVDILGFMVFILAVVMLSYGVIIFFKKKGS